ncbi:MAG TPA: histidine kinase, partial [Chloroflexota bacterium]
MRRNKATAPHHPWLADGVRVMLLEVFVVGVTMLAATHDTINRPLDAFAYLLLLASGGAFAFSRRWPVGAVALALLATLAYQGLRYPGGPIEAGLIATLYKAATPNHLWRSVAMGSVTVVSFFVVSALASGDVTQNIGGGLTFTVALVAIPLAVGHALANHRAYVAAIEDRARLAEQTREAEAQRRVSEERLRIARELHDIVSHTISVINVQAGVAAHVMADQPEFAHQALLTIKATSKEALRELRGMLGVLRDVDAAQPRGPAPGLAQLDVLIATATQAGIATNVAIEGEPRPLPPAVDLAAYRIIQEALTNVLRHAGPAAAEVCVSYAPSSVRIEVHDDGQGTVTVIEPQERSGHG